MKATSFDARADEVVAFTRAKHPQCATWIELSNLVFGPGGPCHTAFHDRAERERFFRAPQGQEVQQLIASLPDAPTSPTGGAARSDYSGRLVVRLPQSLHAALAREAEMERTSLNQLIVSKLSMQLGAVAAGR